MASRAKPTEERDYLTNVETARSPDSAPMTRSRDAVLVFTAGAESADPQPPALPATHVEIARVLVDTIQVVSITMMTGNAIASTEGLDQRAKVLEDFKSAIEPRVTSLASDLTALANAMKAKGDGGAVSQLFRDMAIVKKQLEIPDTAADYGADRFLTDDESDVADAAGQGYDAKIEEGVRFPDANADVSELSIFSANDPNAAISGGLLLPAYADILKLGVTTYHSDLGIAQYGFQTFDLKRLTMSRQRLRYGSVFTICSNNAWWRSGTYDSATNTFRKDGETFEVLDYQVNGYSMYGFIGHDLIRLRKVWTDTYSEPYWGYVTVDHEITGAQVAQTFLVSNDMWATKLGFYLTSKAAAENVLLTLAETKNGQPDLERVILHQSVAHASLAVGDWTRVAIAPTFLKAGTRYAMVLTSNANHKIGMAYGQAYLDGTFFYSTDGAYYQGDLTKDMLFEVWGARFNAPQVAIELDALNLDGGILSIDILAQQVAPKSTSLVFEAQPGGAGTWIPLNASDLTAFDTTPPLTRFRARFIGTRDIQPGLMLTGSECAIARPKTAFKHVSSEVTLAAPSATITVQCILENFDEVPHDFAVKLWDVANTVLENPDTVEDVALADMPDITNRVQRTFTFNLAAPISAFNIVATGSTTSAANTFHLSQRLHWAT
jgi:hypothetical protein